MFLKFRGTDGNAVYIKADTVEAVLVDVDEDSSCTVIRCVTGNNYYVSDTVEEVIERVEKAVVTTNIGV